MFDLFIVKTFKTDIFALPIWTGKVKALFTSMIRLYRPNPPHVSETVKKNVSKRVTLESSNVYVY